MDQNWSFGTYVVSNILKPDALHNGLMERMKDEAVLVVSHEPEVVARIVEAMAIFASELPSDVVKATLDRLADDERRSLGKPLDEPLDEGE